MDGIFKDFGTFLQAFMALGGVGALFSVLTNIFKTIGWVKDGQAPRVVIGLNLLGLVALFFLGIFKPDADLPGIDGIAGTIATILAMVFGLVWQMISSKATYGVMKGVPVLGHSNTEAVEAQKAKQFMDEQARRQEG